MTIHSHNSLTHSSGAVALAFGLALAFAGSSPAMAGHGTGGPNGSPGPGGSPGSAPGGRACVTNCVVTLPPRAPPSRWLRIAVRRSNACGDREHLRVIDGYLVAEPRHRLCRSDRVDYDDFFYE